MNKCFWIVFVLVFLFSISLRSQGLNFQWAKGIGYGRGLCSGTSVKVDAAGNTYVAGSIRGTVDFNPPQRIELMGNVTEDFFLAKYDANGNYVWATSFGNDQFDEVTSLDIDASGNLYITGCFSNIVDFDPSPTTTYTLNAISTRDVFFAKYSSSGGLLWVKQIVGGLGQNSPTSVDNGQCLKLDALNNIYITGYFSNTVDFDLSPSVYTLTSSGGAGFIAKYDNTGNFLWVEQSYEICSDIDIDTNGDIVVAGYSDYDIYFAKYTPVGNLVWSNTIGDTGTDNAKRIETDSNGNIFICGKFSSSVDFDPSPAIANLFVQNSGFSSYLAKYDSNGNYIWAISTGGNGSDNNNMGILTDAVGNVFLTGNFSGVADFDPSAATTTLASSNYLIPNAFIAKYDPTGSFIWAKAFGGSIGSSLATDPQFDQNNNLVLTGYFNCTGDFDPSVATATLNGKGPCMFVGKYNSSSGNYISAFSPECGVGENDEVTVIKKNTDNGIIVAGRYSGEVDFDPNSSTNIQTTPYSNCFTTDSDNFLARYDDQGNLIWVKTIIGTGATYDQIRSIEVDTLGNIFVVGVFFGTLDFNSLDPLATITSNPNNVSSYVARYDSGGNLIWVKLLVGIAQINFIELVENTNFYICGKMTGPVDFDLSATTYSLSSSGWSDSFFAKYDLDGNLTWAYNLESGIGEAKKIVINNGFLYLTGSYSGGCDFIPGPQSFTLGDNGGGNGFLAKYDINGVFNWARHFGGDAIDNGYDIIIDSNENINLLGTFQDAPIFATPNNTITLQANSPYEDHTFLAKYDSSGNALWVNNLGRLSYYSSHSFVKDNFNNLIISGTFENTVDFDPSPGLFNLTAIGQSDIVFVKYDNSGNFIFATNMGGTDAVGFGPIEIDNNDNLYLGAVFYKTIDFDPSPSIFNLSSHSSFLGSYDGSIVKYFSCNSAPSNTNNIDGNIAVCLGDATTYSLSPIYGATSYNWSFPTGWVSSGSNNSITAIAGNSGIISVYVNNLCGTSNSVGINISVDSCAVNIDQESKESSPLFQIKPNPSNGIYTLTSDQNSGGIKAEVYNAIGQIISDQIINMEHPVIDIQKFDKGLYYLKLITPEKEQVIKLIKQ